MTGERDDEREASTPSLEPPSLFGRKRGRRKPPPAEAAAPAPAPVAPPVAPAPEPPRAAPAPPPAPAPAPMPSPAPVRRRPVAAPAAPVAAPVVAPLVEAAPEPAVEPEIEPEEPREPREPRLTGRPATAVTGLLVGAFVVVATAASQQLCSVLKGTATCGGPGFFLLVAILIVAVVIGSAALRVAQVPEPGSTALLAVGLVSVVTLLFLVGQLFQWWMIIAIPLVSVVMFLVSHWVTTTYVDPDEI